ncbi:MAG: hypothetical protein KY412_04120 [Actinobacteria bacterium]|nr:hypothetical protein [Actinomycetota bacterium]
MSADAHPGEAAPPAGGPPPPPEPLSARQTERRVGHYVWLERRRFEVLGRLAASVAEPEAKVLLATSARHHAWHASLWEAHLPRRSGPGTTGLVAPGDAGLAACLEAAGEHDAEPSAIEGLAGAYRVVATRAISAYGRHLERASTVSDAALVRTCRLVLGDQLDDWRHGEALLQSLLTTAAAVDRAAAHQARLEHLLARPASGAGEE